MRSLTQIKLVLLAYRLIITSLLVTPLALSGLNTFPYRNEILAVLYTTLLIGLIAKAYLLGGGINIPLSIQINQNYALRLKQVTQRYLDLHCLSLFRVGGVWLAFPAAWSSNMANPHQLFLVYQASLELCLDRLSPPAAPAT